MVVRVRCREEEIEFFGVLLIYSEDQVDPLVDIFAHMLSLELFAQDPGQVEGIGCIWRHLHVVHEQLSGHITDCFLLAQSCMISVPVLVKFWTKVVFWYHLSVATV